MSDTFPRQYARTQRLTLGEPRTITVSPDGRRVVFCRAGSGTDSVTSLWVLDVDASRERCVADADELMDHTSGSDSEFERARRERAREGAAGIVTYSCDDGVTKAAFTMAGRLFVVDLMDSSVVDVTPGDLESAIFDPRLSPCGRRIAYVVGNDLHVRQEDGSTSVIARGSGDVSWGRAEFIAAEEMGRHRGHWWSPDGDRLVVARVDESPVETSWIADPAHPQRPPRAVRYPRAGTNNAVVSAYIVTLDARQTPIVWDAAVHEYLTSVVWSRAGLVIGLHSRDQRVLTWMSVDQSTGTTTVRSTERDERWVELVPGTPNLTASGVLLTCGERDGVRALLADGVVISPSRLQVRAMIHSSDTHATISANELTSPEVLHTYRIALDGSTCEQLTSGGGMHSSYVGGTTIVTRSTSLATKRATFTVSNGSTIGNRAEVPLVTPNVSLHRLGERRIPTAIVTPTNHDGRRLPVLFDPYGGPHAQRVVSSSLAYCASQWFADQGFVVVVADGAGTPGLGTRWERDVAGDLAGPVLRDQLSVLDELPDVCEFADCDSVAIRGWSFGGYLAALAVLRAPERFHAAIAGAPVTDWRLYDTHYTERYLGHPDTAQDAYDSTNLVRDAALLRRPLLLIHGLADDNVLSAHTLQLSSALLAHGKPHETLLLSGVSHMTPQEVVAENLLLHQVDFLRRSLNLSEN